MQIIDLEKRAGKAYQDSKYEQAIDLYGQLISKEPSQPRHLINRATVYNTIQKCEQAIIDNLKAEELGGKPAHLYVNLANCYRKLQKNDKALESVKRGLTIHLDNKKLQSVLKDLDERTIVDDEETYVQKTFEKFCEHPKLRTYLGDESFLTKLEMMVRNPAIVNQLAKVDKRILEAYDVMMMSQQF